MTENDSKTTNVIFHGLSDAKAKIKVIKAILGITGLGLKEAKTLVESPPTVIKRNVNFSEANQIINDIRSVGGIVQLSNPPGLHAEKRHQKIPTAMEYTAVQKMATDTYHTGTIKRFSLRDFLVLA